MTHRQWGGHGQWSSMDNGRAWTMVGHGQWSAGHSAHDTRPIVEAGLPHYRNHSNWRSPLGTTGGGGSAALPEPLATPDLNPPEQIFRKTQPPMHVHPSPCGPSRERRLVMSPQGLRSLTGTGSAIDPAREGERVKQRKRESDEARMGERAKPAPSRCPLVGVLAGRHDDASSWPEYDDASM